MIKQLLSATSALANGDARPPEPPHPTAGTAEAAPENVPATAPAYTQSDLIAWGAAVFCLFMVFQLHLLSALMTGLLVFELVHALAEQLRVSSIGRRNAKLLAVGLLTISVVTLLILAVAGIGTALRHGSDSLPALLQKLAEVLDSSRQRLPQSLDNYLPADVDDLRSRLALWLREHSELVSGAGLLAGRAAAHILIGIVLGSLMALHDSEAPTHRGPLASVIAANAAHLSDAFRRVVFAQAWIAAINTFITAMFLFVVLPLFGVELPLRKSLVALTFLFGMLPIIGNLISNVAIITVALSQSFSSALAALVFLIAVHKLEYFLNARIIGGQIRARAWELLLAMLIMEAAFGIYGVIAAPIFYAYMKGELARKGLV